MEFIVSLNFAIVTFQMYMLFQCKHAHQTSVPKRYTTSRPSIRGPFRLYDTENNVVNDTALRGSWMLMYFGYTSSLYLGPVEVWKITHVVKPLGALLTCYIPHPASLLRIHDWRPNNLTTSDSKFHCHIETPMLILRPACRTTLINFSCRCTIKTG
jgi:hypothetical protein